MGDVLVMFQPTIGRPSTGTADKDGKFTMRYTKDLMGVAAGENTVYIQQQFDNPELPKPTAAIKALLEKYNREDSSYKITVDKAEVDFELKLD